jgi:hypothetical protein
MVGAVRSSKMFVSYYITACSHNPEYHNSSEGIIDNRTTLGCRRRHFGSLLPLIIPQVLHIYHYPNSCLVSTLTQVLFSVEASSVPALGYIQSKEV